MGGLPWDAKRKEKERILLVRSPGNPTPCSGEKQLLVLGNQEGWKGSSKPLTSMVTTKNGNFLEETIWI
jgi:hypothetical protein